MRYVGFAFEALPCIIFIINSRKNKGAVYLLLGFFVSYVFINEILGYLLNYVFHKATTNIYVVYDVVSVCVYSYIFYRIFPKTGAIQKALMSFIATIIVLLILSNYFLNYTVENYYKIKVLAGIYLVSLSCYFLYSEFVNDDMSDFLAKKPGFWIAAGVLIFYSGYSIVITLHHFTYSQRIFLAGLSLHNFFAKVLSVFLYSCLSVALILWKPIKNSTNALNSHSNTIN